MLRHAVLVFFTLLSASGLTLAQETDWAFKLGGTSYDKAVGLATDDSGYVAVTGSFRGTIDLDPGADTFNVTSNGTDDIFLAKYDTSGNFIWGVAYGTSALYEGGQQVAMDSEGAVYMVGNYGGTIDFDPGSGTANMSPQSGTNAAFIVKYDKDGDYEWSVTTYGDWKDESTEVVVDNAGNVIWFGEYGGTVDFDPSVSVANLTNSSGRSFFMAKYTSSGAFIDVQEIGGTSTGLGGFTNANVDDDNNLYMVGYWSGTIDLNPSLSSTSNRTSSNWDGFIIKLDSNWTYQWDYALNGAYTERIHGIDIDASGNIAITGFFRDTMDFDVKAGVSNVVSYTPQGSGDDIFLAVYDSNMDLDWVHHFGYNASGSWSMSGRTVQYDADGDLLLGGTVEGNVDLDPGAGSYNISAGGAMNMFIAKYTSTGDFVYAWEDGGNGFETVYELAIDPYGAIVSCGQFENTQNFEVGSGTLNISSNGARDGYLMRHVPLCGNSNFTTSADTAVCVGDSAILQAFNGAVYNWDSLGSSSQISVQPDSSTTYYVSGLSSTGCLAYDSVSVTVNALPSISVSNDTSVCGTQSVTLSASGGNIQIWSNGLGSGSTKTVSPTQSTTYHVFVLDSNTCESNDSIQVTVWALPNANAGSNESECTGDSITLSATGGTSYVWNNGLGAGQTHQVLVSSTTTYTVTVTDGNGCEDTDQVTITALPVPTASSAGDTTICPGDSAQISASGGTLYQWGNAVGTATQTVEPDSTTTYIVTVSNTFWCSDTATVTVSVYHNTNIGISADTNICIGDTATLMGFGGVSYAWSGSLGSASTALASPDSTTTYSVQITDSGSCQYEESVEVTVLSLPTITTTGDTSICFGDFATIAANGGSTYDWNQGVGMGSIHMVSPTETTTYTVLVTDANGCKNSDSLTIDILPAPFMSVSNDDSICSGEEVIITAAGGVSISWNQGLDSIYQHTLYPTQNTQYIATVYDASGCKNQDTIMVFVFDNPNVSINNNQFTFCANESPVVFGASPNGGAFTGSGMTGSTFDPLAAGIGTHTISYSFTDSVGCSGTDDQTIEVLEVDTVTAAFGWTTSGNTVSFINLSTNGLYWAWQFGNTDTSSQFEPVYTYNNGIYLAQLVAKNACDSDTVIHTVKINPLAIPEVADRAVIDVFPNPSMGVYTIKGEQSTIKHMHVYDARGNVIPHNEWMNGDTRTIDITSQAAGMYFLVFVTSDGTLGRTSLVKQ